MTNALLTARLAGDGLPKTLAIGGSGNGHTGGAAEIIGLILGGVFFVLLVAVVAVNLRNRR